MSLPRIKKEQDRIKKEDTPYKLMERNREIAGGRSIVLGFEIVSYGGIFCL